MSVFAKRVLAIAVVALGMGSAVSTSLSGQTAARPPAGETEWRFFGGDSGATRYSPAS